MEYSANFALTIVNKSESTLNFYRTAFTRLLNRNFPNKEDDDLWVTIFFVSVVSVFLELVNQLLDFGPDSFLLVVHCLADFLQSLKSLTALLKLLLGEHVEKESYGDTQNQYNE